MLLRQIPYGIFGDSGEIVCDYSETENPVEIKLTEDGRVFRFEPLHDSSAGKSIEVNLVQRF